jgi:hypothetical protein
MQKVNHPLKARMFVGGLKSLLIDVVNDIEEIEKTGSVTNKFIECLGDVKSAIELTLKEFGKVTVRCCEHGTAHSVCDKSCEEDYCSDCESDPCACEIEDDDHCPDCKEYEDECVCDLDDEDDEEEELPPPPPSPFIKGKPAHGSLKKAAKAVKAVATKKKGG